MGNDLMTRYGAMASEAKQARAEEARKQVFFKDLFELALSGKSEEEMDKAIKEMADYLAETQYYFLFRTPAEEYYETLKQKLKIYKELAKLAASGKSKEEEDKAIEEIAKHCWLELWHLRQFDERKDKEALEESKCLLKGLLEILKEVKHPKQKNEERCEIM